MFIRDSNSNVIIQVEGYINGEIRFFTVFILNTIFVKFSNCYLQGFFSSKKLKENNAKKQNREQRNINFLQFQGIRTSFLPNTPSIFNIEINKYKITYFIFPCHY